MLEYGPGLLYLPYIIKRGFYLHEEIHDRVKQNSNANTDKKPSLHGFQVFFHKPHGSRNKVSLRYKGILQRFFDKTLDTKTFGNCYHQCDKRNNRKCNRVGECCGSNTKFIARISPESQINSLNNSVEETPASGQFVAGYTPDIIQYKIVQIFDGFNQFFHRI